MIVAAVLAGPLPAIAAEPVRQIGIYVQPFYEAARVPGERPRVAVGKQYNDLLSSDRREDILAARDLIVAKPALVTPMTMMVLAIRLYDVGLRDDVLVLRRQGSLHRVVGRAQREDAPARPGR